MIRTDLVVYFSVSIGLLILTLYLGQSIQYMEIECIKKLEEYCIFYIFMIMVSTILFILCLYQFILSLFEAREIRLSDDNVLVDYCFLGKKLFNVSPNSITRKKIKKRRVLKKGDNLEYMWLIHLSGIWYAVIPIEREIPKQES